MRVVYVAFIIFTLTIYLHLSGESALTMNDSVAVVGIAAVRETILNSY